jgi:hypothetical protein
MKIIITLSVLAILVAGVNARAQDKLLLALGEQKATPIQQPNASIRPKEKSADSCSPLHCRNDDSECTGLPQSACGFCWAGVCGPSGGH